MSERGYIDNVPLRLTPKYYPQPRPQFKEIDIHIPIDALQDDYDFSLERSALTEISAWEEHKVQEEQRRAEQAARRAQEEEERRLAEELRLKEEEEERLRKEEEERIRLEKEEAIRQEEERIRLKEEEKRKKEEEIRKAEEERKLAEEELKRQAEEERLRIEQQERLRLEEEAKKVEEERRREEEARRHQEEELGRLARLKEDVSSPTSNLNSTAGHESSKESSSSNVSSPEGVESTYCVANNKLHEATSVEKQRVVPSFRRNTSINLSDFESDTANPFDNVEINSINEMEVLASILKNNSVSVPPSHNYSARCNQNLSSGTAHYGSGVSHQSQQTPHTQHLQHHQQPTYQQSSPAVNCYPAMHNNTHHQSYPAQPPPHSHQQWNYFAPSPGSPSSTPELSIRRDVTTAPPPLQTTNQSNNPVTSSNSFTKYYFPLLTSMADSNRDRQSARNNINHGYSQSLPISGANPQPTGLNAGLNPFLNPSNSPVQQFPLLGSLSNPPQFQTYWGNEGQVAGPLASQTCNMTSISQPNGPPISASKPSLSHSQTGTDLSASTANGSQHPLR